MKFTPSIFVSLFSSQWLWWAAVSRSPESTGSACSHILGRTAEHRTTVSRLKWPLIRWQQLTNEGQRSVSTGLKGQGRWQHPLPTSLLLQLCQAPLRCPGWPVSTWDIPCSHPQSYFLSHSSAEAASYVFLPLPSSFFLLLFVSLQLTEWVLHFWAFALKFKKTHLLHTFAAHLKMCYFICLKVKIEYTKDTAVYKMKALSTEQSSRHLLSVYS